MRLASINKVIPQRINETLLLVIGPPRLSRGHRVSIINYNRKHAHPPAHDLKLRRANKFPVETRYLARRYRPEISNCWSKWPNVSEASVAHVSYDLAVRHRPPPSPSPSFPQTEYALHFHDPPLFRIHLHSYPLRLYIYPASRFSASVSRSRSLNRTKR